MLRVLIAGVVGGLLVFFGGAIDRTQFKWGSRTFTRFDEPQEQTIVEFFRNQRLPPGIYAFPQMPASIEELPADVRTREQARINQAYKDGPAAFIVVAPPGEDMMGPHTLIAEALTNVAAALFVSWIVAQATTAGLFKRWLICVVFAMASWLSLLASYAIWYRFPGNFIHDELFCTLFEWAIAGLAIAVIVRPRPPVEVAVVVK